jgi:hypothetical protein
VIEPLYVAARGVLPDALDPLGDKRETLILAGAQALHIHTGAADRRWPSSRLTAIWLWTPIN